MNRQNWVKCKMVRCERKWARIQHPFHANKFINISFHKKDTVWSEEEEDYVLVRPEYLESEIEKQKNFKPDHTLATEYQDQKSDIESILNKPATERTHEDWIKAYFHKKDQYDKSTDDNQKKILKEHYEYCLKIIRKKTPNWAASKKWTQVKEFF